MTKFLKWTAVVAIVLVVLSVLLIFVEYYTFMGKDRGKWKQETMQAQD